MSVRYYETRDCIFVNHIFGVCDYFVRGFKSVSSSYTMLHLCNSTRIFEELI